MITFRFKLFNLIVEANHCNFHCLYGLVQVLKLRVLLAKLPEVLLVLIRPLLTSLHQVVEVCLQELKLIVHFGDVAETNLKIFDHPIYFICKTLRVIVHLFNQCHHLRVLRLRPFLKLCNVRLDLFDHLVCGLSILSKLGNFL